MCVESHCVCCRRNVQPERTAPKLKVCTTAQHLWCYGCKQNHHETPAPRIVEDKA